jgi:DNA-binding SARP family transcriptional activator/TolB-like protein
VHVTERAVRLKLFGGFKASTDGCAVDVKLKRARLLLAYLALAPSGRASREELMALLWSERGEAQARQSLRQTVAVIRKAFLARNIDLVQGDAEAVVIDLKNVTSDVAAFRHLAVRNSLEDLESAVGLYAGDFLTSLWVPDLCAEDWILARRNELQSSFLRCLGSLLTAYRRLERLPDVERVATRILGLDPLDEEAHRGLITVHLARGKRSLAFRQLHHCRESLQRELAVRPSAETEALLRDPVQANIARAEVRAQRIDTVKISEPTRARPIGYGSPSVRRKPSLIVTPLEVLGEGTRADVLAYGLVDDIVVHLSRFSSLFVVPPGPAMSLNLHPVDPGVVGSTLGVRYVLTGSLQVVDDRVRIASMLLDAENGHVVWAEHYDRRLTDFIGVRDDVGRRIAVAASSSADTAEFERIKLFDTHQLGAWELRALAQRRFLAYTPDQNAEARSLFSRALQIDPSFVRAQVGLGWTYFEDFSLGWSADPQKSLQKSYELACGAAAAEPGLYSTRCLLSYIHFNRRQYGEAIEECGRARADNPNDPEVLLHEGHLLSCTGRTETGIDRVEEAISLDPCHPNWFHYIHGIAAFEAERFETSRMAVNRYIELQHGPFVGLKASALRVRAAANAVSGRIEAARQDADAYLALKPDFSVSTYVRGMPRQDPISFERMTSALRTAGFPA